jgi:hypothetical protein
MEILYTVKYRLPGQWFWRKIKNVKGDSSIPELTNTNHPYRIILKADGGRFEIPWTAEFVFSKEREASIAASIRREAGR